MPPGLSPEYQAASDAIFEWRLARPLDGDAEGRLDELKELRGRILAAISAAAQNGPEDAERVIRSICGGSSLDAFRAKDGDGDSDARKRIKRWGRDIYQHAVNERHAAYRRKNGGAGA